MQTGSIHAMQIVFLLLLLFIVFFGYVAKKLQTPYPIVLVVGGLLISFIPGIPRVSLNPDLVFLLVLPPLLYHAAWNTSWREFSYHLVSIVLLAFGLVAFTVFGVTQAGHFLLPGFDWRVGLVLGAVVAPTDAIAATTIAKRIGLPKRIVDILEGESLLNDATALLALEFGIALLVGGERPTFTAGLLRLLYLTLAGVGVGLLLGEIVHQVEDHIEDGPIEIALSLVTPYAAYLAAESARASGVLAVVACGLYLSRRSSHFYSPAVRLQAWAVWDSLAFIVNGLVFLLIGLQLPYVLGAISEYKASTLLLYGAGFSAFLIVLRMVWVYPGTFVANVIRKRVLHQKDTKPSLRGIFIVGWTGMRGVISLAAAVSLPQVLANGEPFAQRNMIIFLTFSVILVTLVLQGLTLPALIRALGLAGSGTSGAEEKEARRAMAEAALQYIERASQSGNKKSNEVYEDLAQHYRHRLATLNDGDSTDPSAADFYKNFVDASRELIEVERRTAINLRNQRRISDSLLRDLEYELDLSDIRLVERQP
jgi:CPA1 family monovalent cation:H+ antiporter